jgi:Uma2 family endonuclease
MSTITLPESVPKTKLNRDRAVAGIPGEQRIVIRGLSWDLYDRLSDAIREGDHVYLAYDGKDLEIMTTGRLHDDYKELFGRFMNAITYELAIPNRGAGQTTWKRPELERGLEADQSYYFEPAKLAADAKGLARKSNNVADYPNPDLAIEVDISASQVDRPSIYAALKVPEVWRFDGESLTIEILQPDGTYLAVDSSRFLPIQAKEVVRWLVEEDVSDMLAWERRLRTWIRDELVPRMKP